MLWTAPRLGVRVVGGLIVVAVVAFACAPVLLSHDAFSYVDYARLGVKHGLDPYVNAPDAAPTDPAFAHVTWTETPSAYGPLFTIATYPLAWLPVWAAIAVLKAVAAISVLGLAWVVSRLAAWRGVDEAQAAAFVALNPLVLVHVVGGAHNDGLAMLLAMLGVAALVARREASSGALLVASAAIKSSSLFVAPFAFVEAAPRARRRWAEKRLISALFGPSTGLSLGAVGAAVVFAVGGLRGVRVALAARVRARRGKPGTDQPPFDPGHLRPADGNRRGRGAGRGARPLRRRRRLASGGRPGGASTGSAPPPGRASASCSPPRGSCPGTSSGRCRSSPSPATAASPSSSSPSPPTS